MLINSDMRGKNTTKSYAAMSYGLATGHVLGNRQESHGGRVRENSRVNLVSVTY